MKRKAMEQAERYLKAIRILEHQLSSLNDQIDEQFPRSVLSLKRILRKRFKPLEKIMKVFDKQSFSYLEIHITGDLLKRILIEMKSDKELELADLQTEFDKL